MTRIKPNRGAVVQLSLFHGGEGGTYYYITTNQLYILISTHATCPAAVRY